MGLSFLLPLLVAATPAQTREAQALAHRSIVEYNVGDFETALHDAVAAYEADPIPALLFNVAQCHRALGHWNLAAFAYRGYLRGLPDAPNRKDVERLIAEMDARTPEEAPPAVAPAPKTEAPPQSTTQASAPSVAPEATEEATAKPRHSRALAYTVGAVGVAAAVVAVIGFVNVGEFDGTSFKGVSDTAAQPKLTTAQAWDVTAIVCTVVAVAGLGTAALTW